MELKRKAEWIFLTMIAVLVFSSCGESPGGKIGRANSADINIFTPLIMQPLADPVPVKGSDGRYHFVYELQVTNGNKFSWELQAVEVMGGGEIMYYQIPESEISGKMQWPGNRQPVARLAPNESALLFIAFSVKSRESIPETLRHKISVSVPGGLPDEIKSLLQLPEKQESLTYFTGDVTVDPQAVIALAPPLKGSGWIAANGCCDSVTHIRANLPINGELHISQRFAIDWMKVNKDHRLYEGDPHTLSNWFGYGQEVLAVADAQVVTVVDKFQNQTPFVLPADSAAITLEEIDGNHLVLALGNGQFAFYAHLQPGSIRVKVGDKVRTGQPLALLGNTGNTGAPHLHFHVMQSGSSLGSNGLPYTFKQFKLLGKTTEAEFFERGLEDNTPLVVETGGIIEGNVIGILPLAEPGFQREALPLDLSLIEFDSKH